KVAILIWLQLLIRWSMIRIRYDQIQTLGWKILLPLALANIIVSAVLILVDPSLTLLAIVGLVELALLIGITVLYRAPAKPASIRFAGQPAATKVATGHGH